MSENPLKSVIEGTGLFCYIFSTLIEEIAHLTEEQGGLTVISFDALVYMVKLYALDFNFEGTVFDGNFSIDNSILKIINYMVENGLIFRIENKREFLISESVISYWKYISKED